MEAAQAAAALFDAVHHFFDIDDGSLPEVQIDGITPHEAQAMFEVLLPLGNPLRADQTVWDDERDAEAPVSEFPDAGRLAAEGRLASLHVVLTALQWKEGDLPHLGVSAWPGTLALDYPGGSTWSVDVVARFIDLVCALRDLSESSRLVLAAESSAPLPEDQQARFRRAVEEYCGSAQ